MRVDELVVSLQTFELGINDISEKKNKSVAFVSNTENEEDQCDLDTNERLSNTIVILEKQFNGVLKRLERRGRPNVKNITSDISNNLYSHKKTRIKEKSNQGNDIQRYECEGYGHIIPECPTFLKNRKKGLNVSWFDDDETEDDSNSETAKLVMALFGRWADEVESCDENILYDGLHVSYNEAYDRYEANLKTVEDQKKVISKLESGKNELLSYSKANQVSKKISVKDRDVNLIAHTSLRGSTSEDWYFAHRCSRHMTGVHKYLVDLKSHPTSFIKFSDVIKGEIKGVGKLTYDGSPSLEYVLLVKGLTANLIRISQLYDQRLFVNFSKSKCLVKDKKDDVMMKGIRSKGNCYM
ncbi:uncharacterized protein LOC127080775 [Lathyrus oleraceus]|uniref:uncharacterized protein LOC127080775 n=1 Tax=Pisum sativum TaxID=3888 RepID=UPI0021CF3FFE|nr:uncharacterized protein LOC127080775 [Pisum sativum]